MCRRAVVVQVLSKRCKGVTVKRREGKEEAYEGEKLDSSSRWFPQNRGIQLQGLRNLKHGMECIIGCRSMPRLPRMPRDKREK